MNFIKMIISGAAFAIAFASCKKENVMQLPVVAKNKIAYIFKSDSTDAVAFKHLMQQNGCGVTLVDKVDVAVVDYSSYNMIVVGHNTDQGSSASTWSSAESAAIKQSNKPVLFIGLGGLQLAAKMGNVVNYGNCASGDVASFMVNDESSSIYKSPKNISAANAMLLNIFKTASPSQMFYAPVTPVNNVVLIGKQPQSPSAYYPVGAENDHYTFFGFYNNVDAMTSTGKDFMVNLVYYTGKLSL